MNATEQAVFVLEVLLAIGPLSLYFLGLGLVNSQARPCLVGARTDFALLAAALVPVIGLPALALAQRGQPHLAAAAVAALAGMFFSLLPRRDSGWVLYNCSPAQARRLLQQATRRLPWPATRHDDGSLVFERPPLRVTQSALPVLRSVTIHLESPTTPETRAVRDALIAALRGELAGETMLPSATGASLVLIGASLLGLPMWYFFHNINAIVEAVRRFFSA